MSLVTLRNVILEAPETHPEVWEGRVSGCRRLWLMRRPEPTAGTNESCSMNRKRDSEP